ncbi:MAG: family 16 glycosylhydrolase [Chitinivibrionales bacterium]
MAGKRGMNIRLGIFMVIFAFISLYAKEYKGGELFSNEPVKYGAFEMRMAMGGLSGSVCSFFLYYDDSWLGEDEGEPWQEVDIEVLGKNNESVQSNLITGSAENKETSEEDHDIGEDLSAGYHTYRVEWTPDYIAWYVDGNEVRRSSGSQVEACTEKSMTYRFNHWISSSTGWTGEFSPENLPAYQYINWIEFYEYTPGEGEDGGDFSFSWRDDFDTFDDSRWGKGDWTFDENLVDFIPENIVVQDGKCIICLTDSTNTGFTGQVMEDASSIRPSMKEGTSPSGDPALRIEPGNHSGKPNFIYNLHSPAEVSISIYSTAGRLLFSETQGLKSKGEHEADIPANLLSTGIYTGIVEYNGKVCSESLVFVK